MNAKSTDPVNWSALRLKHEEAEYFLGQMAANTRHPKLFLFHLSAFLSSARSLTFHVQKIASNIGRMDLYEQLRQKMLSDELCRFFVNSRNQSEKESFLDLAFECIVSGNIWNGNPHEVSVANRRLRLSSEGTFDTINDALMTDWDRAFQYLGNSDAFDVRPRWYFCNAPLVESDGTNDALDICAAYLKRLWRFLVAFRAELN
jgi:hypothetical protein